MKKFKLIIGMLLLPLFVAIYYTDRILTVAMFWIEQVKMKQWFAGTKEMTQSFIRVLTGLIIFGLYQLIIWIF